MKTNLMFLLFTLIFVNVNAQSNWITSNFKSYLTSGMKEEYVTSSEKFINNLVDYDREKSYYAILLFKAMSGYNHNRLPICQFNIATSAVGISIKSKYLNENVTLFYCFIGGAYYYFISNTLRNNGVDVGLYGKSENTSGSFETCSSNCGAPSYSVAFFHKNTSYLDFSVTSFRKLSSLERSPCF